MDDLWATIKTTQKNHEEIAQEFSKLENSATNLEISIIDMERKNIKLEKDYIELQKQYEILANNYKKQKKLLDKMFDETCSTIKKFKQ